MLGAYRVGIDIEGTFTDIVVNTGGGALARRKALSTPGGQAETEITRTMAAGPTESHHER